MYMGIYNKYDGNITYIPISKQEVKTLDIPIRNRSIKYIITAEKDLQVSDFEIFYGKKIFEPIVDTYIPVNTNRKTDNEIKRLEDFFSFIYALICRRNKGLYNRDIGTIDEIERYIWNHFGIAP